MGSVFIQLAIILGTAFIVAYIVRALRQPIIIGYIVAGILISPFILELGASEGIISLFSEFGIAFLLFIVGLHLNPKVIREIGGSSLVVGLGQIILTFGLGYALANFVLGYNMVASLYIGVALAFSSTIIVLKLLSDKKQIDSLYGKISIGILIIQDLVAIAALMIISSMSSGTTFSTFAMKTLLGGGLLIICLFLLGYFILPRIMHGIARSQELLFLFSICWCFAIAALFIYIGFSIEIGALIAGVVLSISPYSTEISARIRPLRDFFLIVFFIILGLNIPVASIGSVIVNALILSAAVLIFKPLVLMTFLGFLGYTKRTNFMVGTTLAQISEFSLIVLALGASIGHISGELVTTMTLTGVITIALSTYLIIFSQRIYDKLSRVLSIFERKSTRMQKKIGKKYDAILFGYNRIGFGILRAMKEIKKKYLVVDFNPDTVESLTKYHIPSLYGDAYDADLLEELPLAKIELAVSTIPDFETNLLLIDTIRRVNPKAIIIVSSQQIGDALELYNRGASYVLTPHFLGGEYVAKMIREEDVDAKAYCAEKDKHIKMLEERLKRGHRHPRVEED